MLMQQLAQIATQAKLNISQNYSFVSSTVPFLRSKDSVVYKHSDAFVTT